MTDVVSCNDKESLPARVRCAVAAGGRALRLVHRQAIRESDKIKEKFGGLLSALRPGEADECPAAGFSCKVTQEQVPRMLAVLPHGNFASVIPGDSVAETVITSGIASSLNLYQSALIVRVILTWFPQAPPFLVQPLSTICDPYLNLFRGLIPPIGGTFDLSPILAFVVLDLLTGSAASLGAEMPEQARSSNAGSKRND